MKSLMTSLSRLDVLLLRAAEILGRENPVGSFFF
jgi:hypothetical protein